MKGKFVISLDYELMWGVRDKKSISDYGGNISNVTNVIDKLLLVFSKYDINATFSIVGFLFAKDKEELLSYLPEHTPRYDKAILSPYNGYINSIGEDESKDPYHYALEDIKKINNYGNHEISTHTFSHYYCLEKGQKAQDFKDDLDKAIKIAQKENIEIKTIIFPRNQHNHQYDKILLDNGIKGYRGNEKTWFYKEKTGKEDSLFRRMMRLIDTYINISGHHCYKIRKRDRETLINIPSSRFLRPYSPKLSFLEKLRLRRVKRSMKYAAINGYVYHLWWHPHNYGSYQEENFKMLEDILQYYKKLDKEFGFESYTMSEFVK